jgi:hypothetical protein
MNKLLLVLLATVLATGCTRIESGHRGVRVNVSKQVELDELQPGSFNQVLLGDVITIPVKDVGVSIDDLTPVAKDNSTMKDFDLVVIYNVNPDSVAELYSTKNRSFNTTDTHGDTYLMYNYITAAARNAVYKSARKYDALDMSDARQAIEQEVKDTIVQTLRDEKLDTALTISQVLVRSITPADTVVDSANSLVRAKNAYKQKEIEVQTAKQEAERIAVLNANKGAIDYMLATAQVTIAEAVRDGKVQTILIPHDMNMFSMSK